ncbi:MAG: 23S rRNA (uracil(1939)-C(5))-methyltransferase RlmD [Bacteroidales bacterium]|nr:23S rRNA (uracil(1939)-C(5))-methyltransferase RlmD [Bacteroidales bacterium]MDD2813012.1 23S rRNA (uracil(1939)-C(5))-methyltransferase RlmD [Bacteroidales bacterium]MDD3812116.1 23S rRNA (uracil(1939)-C(5))-methyltransferase RlmD [Bacteroidales bacterium]MDD4811680.1 23S rRNA (uracil(1939)-C(5))-methyltransferase RlmD [Bacteroidales bacterium]
MKKKPLPLIEKIRIESVGAEGKAVARHENRVIFVPMVIPGDVVDVQVVKKRRTYSEGRMVRIVSPSPDRQKPVCSHFGVCGGCKWQMLPYSLQLKYKSQQVGDQLTRIGQLKLPEIRPIIGAVQPEFYRNKMEYTFSNRRWLTNEEVRSGVDPEEDPALGFHVRGLFDKVVNVDKCWLQPDPANEIRNEVRRFTLEHGFSYFDLRKQTGLMRNLTIRCTSIGEWMVIVSFHENSPDQIRMLMDHLKERFPFLTSLMYVINPKRNDTIADLDVITWYGRDYIIEEMEGLQFKISPKSFFQTNSHQVMRLYQVVRDFAELKGDDVVYDLYTGTGTIALFLARQVSKVIGIEYVPEAIEDARINAEMNEISNAEFLIGDMKDVLGSSLFEQYGQPDLIVLDPPRAGVHPDVITAIRDTDAPRIVYVSCNPATQARDLALLSDRYAIQAVQPVDMFPHTHHVENVVLLKKY